MSIQNPKATKATAKQKVKLSTPEGRKKMKDAFSSPWASAAAIIIYA